MGQALSVNDPRMFISLYLPIVAWLFGLMILFIVLLAKFTFGKWTPANPNPYVSETLGMPTGLFRGLITLTLLYCVVVFEVWNFVAGKPNEETFSQFMVAFQMMIAFYFGSKVVSQLSSSDEKKTETKANAAAAIQGIDLKNVGSSSLISSAATSSPAGEVSTSSASSSASATPSADASSSASTSSSTTEASSSASTDASASTPDASTDSDSKKATESNDDEAAG